MHQVDQVAQVAAQTIQLPDDQSVALPQRFAASGKAGAVISPARRQIVVDVFGGDTSGEQSVALQIEHLGAVSLGDAHVAD
jgi:hypothetical protein